MKHVGSMGLFVGTTAERLAYAAADVGQAWYSTDDLDVQIWNGTGWDAAIPDDAVTAAKIDPTASWGASARKLLNFVPYTSDYFIYGANASDDSDFVATIATLPGGATLTYNDPTSGNENAIVPIWTTALAKLVLHNTTRGTSALISSVATVTNTITLTANVPAGWQVGDTITARSQTNLDAPGEGLFFDFDCSAAFGTTVSLLVLEVQFWDTAAANKTLRLHPYEAISASKLSLLYSPAANVSVTRPVFIPLVSQRFTMLWQASGAATASVICRIQGYFEEAAA